MIRHPHDLKTEQVAHMREGKGSVGITHLLNPDEFDHKGRLFAVNVLKPGCSIGDHPHVGEIEVYHITAGEGMYNDNGTVVAVRAGDVCLTWDGEHHSIENTGQEDLVFTALITYTTKS